MDNKREVSQATDFFLQAFLATDAARQREGQSNLYSAGQHMLSSLGNEVPEEEKMKALKTFTAMHVATFIGETLKAVPRIMNNLGCMLAHIGAPERAERIGVPKPDNLEDEANSLGKELCALLPLIQLAIEGTADKLDFEYIAEKLIAEGQKEEAAANSAEAAGLSEAAKAALAEAAKADKWATISTPSA